MYGVFYIDGNRYESDSPLNCGLSEYIGVEKEECVTVYAEADIESDMFE